MEQTGPSETECLIIAFQDFVSAYLSVAKIERCFALHEFAPNREHCPTVSGARRGTVEKYVVNMNLDDPYIFGRFISVVEDAINDSQVEWGSKEDKTTSIEIRWIHKALERNGFSLNGKTLEPHAAKKPVDDLFHAAPSLSPGAVDDYLRRMSIAVTTDPALAIGSAKELVEAVCKYILRERNVIHSENLSVIKLCALTSEQLGLLPSEVREEKKGSESIKKVLGSLSQIVQGVAELRNMYGTGHGRPNDKHAGISPRHARLAVGAASTLVHFLLETHQVRPHVKGATG